MGNAKKIKCNMCGYEWLQYDGTGLQGGEIANNIEKGRKGNKVKIRCPKCGTAKVKADSDIKILWD